MPRRESSSSLPFNLKIGIAFNIPRKSSGHGENEDLSEVAVEYEAEFVQEALRKLDFEYELFPLKFNDDLENFVRVLKTSKPDVIINLCEGAFGKSYLEMNVAAVFELLGIPFTGSSPLTLGLCQNKGLAKDVLRANGIITPEYRVLNSIKEWDEGMGYPLIVKPSREDASIGISKKSFVKDETELKIQIEYIKNRYKQSALVEKYIDGRELNVAILGSKNPEVLPISEIEFEFADEPKIVDYSAKWLKESDEYKKTKPVCPAKLEPSTEDEVKRIALKAYKVLYCRDYARVDIRLKNETPYVLELNPNPDISADAGFTRSLKSAGISFEEFIKKIIFFALGRKHKC